jgi:hypothetical protein
MQDRLGVKLRAAPAPKSGDRAAYLMGSKDPGDDDWRVAASE